MTRLVPRRSVGQYVNSPRLVEVRWPVLQVGAARGTSVLLQAHLTGDHPAGVHDALPLAPEELARDAQAAVAAGAGAVHIHPWRRGGDPRSRVYGVPAHGRATRHHGVAVRATLAG